MHEVRHALSVIIVTCNRREELRKSLALLEQQDAEFELVVVDNGSTDGSSEFVREFSPGAVLVALPENLGACAGRNRGIQASHGDLLVFLDDDAGFAARDALSRIRALFDGDSSLGIVATHSYLVATGESERDALLRRDKQAGSAACAASHFCAVGFGLRREVIEKVGAFSEDFIYYCEELDLGWRVIDSGYRILWIPDLVVLHRRSTLGRPKGRWVYSNMRNRVRVAIKYLPWRYVISYTLLWWPLLALHSLRSRLGSDFLRGLRDFALLLPATCRQRQRLQHDTLKLIRDLDGRLLY